jgi:hypothetical protein
MVPFEYPTNLRSGKAQMATTAQHYLNLHQAAAYLDLTPEQLLAVLRDGAILARQMGQDYHFAFADVEAYHQQRAAEEKRALGQLAELSDELGLYR